MPIQKVDQVGSIGMLPDLAEHELPLNAWSYGENFRTDKGYIYSAKGYVSNTTPTETAQFIITATDSGGNSKWLYMSNTKGYCYDGSTHTEVTNTGGAYNSTPDSVWNGATFSGVPIVNNGANPPQYWSPVSASQLLQDIPGWQAGYTCWDIKPYKNFLVACDITKSGTRYPNMIKWSSSADAGGMPASWDETDPTLLAGETELVETGGSVVTTMPLRGQNVVYKSTSTYLMNFVGGQFVFSFNLLYPTSGILGKRCVTEFDGKHFVVTNDDVVVHDGQSPVQSIANRKVRDLLFKGISYEQRQKVFVERLKSDNEIWVAFPEEGSLYCNKALVWNINDGSWALRDVPNINHMTTATLSLVEEGTAWNDLSATWNQNDEGWSERLFNPIVETIIAAGQDDIYQMDATNLNNGSPKVTYIERVGIPVGGNDRVCMVKAIYPRMTGDHVEIFVGSQMAASDAIRWEGSYLFTPGEDYKIDCRVTGRLHSIKFYSEDDVSWQIQGYDIEYEDSGAR